MNRTEAIQFYTVKQQRARSTQNKIAYERILILLRTRDFDLAKINIYAASRSCTTPEHRAIYRKAVKELNI